MLSHRNKILAFTATSIFVLANAGLAAAQETVDFSGVVITGNSVSLDTNGDMVDDLLIASADVGPLVVEDSFTANFVYSEMPILSHPAVAGGPEIRLSFLHGLRGPLDLAFSTALGCPKSGSLDLSVAVELFKNDDPAPLASETVLAECISGSPRGDSDFAEGKITILSQTPADYALINYDSPDPSFTPMSIDNISGHFSNEQRERDPYGIPTMPTFLLWPLLGAVAWLGRRRLLPSR